MKSLKRWLHFKRNEFYSWVDRCQLRLDQYRCPHTWRPARINGKPGKLCAFCEKAVPLTREEYYALFAETGFHFSE